MKKISYISFVFRTVLIGVIMASCENEIPYTLDDVEPNLTINAFIYADSLTNRMYLSRTGTTGAQAVGESTVEVTVNGESKERLTAVTLEGTILSFVDITTRFRPGDVVRIDARTADGAHHAWVEETIPQPVEIAQVDTSRVVALPNLSYISGQGVRLKIRFMDRPNEKNYYRIVLEQRYIAKETDQPGSARAEFKTYSFWPWDDIALTDGRPATSEELENDILERVTNFYGVFNDSWFANSDYTLNVQIATTNWSYLSGLDFVPRYQDLDVAVRLLSITESEFYYLNTLNMIDSDILDDYISDPVKIPSNVHGGTGFVGISSESGKIVRLISNEKLEYVDY